MIITESELATIAQPFLVLDKLIEDIPENEPYRKAVNQALSILESNAKAENQTQTQMGGSNFNLNANASAKVQDPTGINMPSFDNQYGNIKYVVSKEESRNAAAKATMKLWQIYGLREPNSIGSSSWKEPSKPNSNKFQDEVTQKTAALFKKLNLRPRNTIE